MTAPISNGPTTTRLHHYAGRYCPARLKTAFFGRFGLAGRTISRTGHSHVTTVKPPSPLLAPKQQPLKPTTPLQPLIRANVKPPSPLLTPQQQPLKPTTPLQPKNTLKTPVSHPQRRRRFQSHAGASEQRRQGFQTTGPPRLQHPNAAPVGGGAWLRCPRAATTPPPPHFARNLSWSFFETPQKRCNSNDANSMFEQVAGELRAKLMGGGEA